MHHPPPRGITTGHIPSEAFALAWPTVASMMLMHTTMVANLCFVGRLGQQALSAAGVGTLTVMILFSVAMAVTTGTVALIARFVGARDPTQAAEAAKQSILLTVVVSTAVAVPLYLVRLPLVQALGVSPGAARTAAAFLAIALAATPVHFLLMTQVHIYRAVGDVITPLKVMVVVNALNVLGDYLLIWGIGPFPRLGVPGAAVTLAIVWTLGSGLMAQTLRHIPIWPHRTPGWRPSGAWFLRILRIGWPAAVQNLIRSVGAMSFIFILAHTPARDAAVGALTAGIRIEGLAWMPGIAFGIAASTMVGQNLGAKQPRRAAQSGWVCAQQAAMLMAVVGVLLWLVAEPVAQVVAPHEPEVIRLVTAYLKINAWAEPLLGVGMVLSGALQGAGDTVSPAVATVVGTWVLRLPITWWLCLGLGHDAIAAWWVMAAGTVAQAIMLIIWFRIGRWKRKEV